MTFWMVSARAGGHWLRDGLLGALVTGVLVALTGFVGSSVAVFIAGHSQFSEVASTSGLHSRLLMLMEAQSTIGAICLLTIPAAVLGAAVLVPVRWFGTRRAGSPAR